MVPAVCILPQISRYFTNNIRPPPSTLQVEAAPSPETWLYFYQNTWHHIPKHGKAHTYSKFNYSLIDMADRQF
jgi:hypothetical protein